VKGYPLDLIYTVDYGGDGGPFSSSPPRFDRNRIPGDTMAASLRELKPYGSPNSTLILPTRSRLREELVLPTYSGRNGPQKAIDG
jgi:hypothetical protein